MSNNESPLRIGIIGAGLSGLSVALALLEQKDFNGEVHLFEPREEYCHDRHWSFWDASEHFFRATPQLRFNNIDFVANNFRSSLSCDDTSYSVLSSDAVYQHAKNALAKDLRFYLNMGTSVIDIIPSSNQLELVLTEQGNNQFDLVFDSRLVKNPDPNGLIQWFKGAEISLENTRSPIKACLMDFCLEKNQPIGFFYVLPLDDFRVLAQLTYFLNPGEAPPENASDIWSDYVSKTLGQNPEAIIREENGCIPMQVNHANYETFGHHAIGTAAGWVRASTGYGFLDIQRAAKRVAKACCIPDAIERERSLRAVKARSHWDDRLDGIFLATLKREPQRAAEFFSSIFSGASSKSVIRFLSGTATWRDRISVMRSLPSAPFIKSLLLSLNQ